MSEFIQALLIISITIVAIVSIVFGKKFSTKVDKSIDGVTAELTVTEDKDTINIHQLSWWSDCRQKGYFQK